MASPGAELDGSGGISLSLTIPVKPLVEALAPFPLTVPDALHPVVAIPIVEPGQVEASRRYYRLADTAGVWAPFVLLGLGALAVALAGRRRRATIWVLVGSGLLAAATGAGALLARDRVVASVADPAGRTIVDAAYPVLIRGFLVEAGVVAVLCVLVALVVGALPHRDGPGSAAPLREPALHQRVWSREAGNGARPEQGDSMGIGLGIFLLVVGAIFYFTGVVDDLVNVNLNTVGLIMMIGGALAIVLGLIMNAQRNRTQHTMVSERRGAPDVVERETRVERRDDGDDGDEVVERRVERRDDRL